VKTKAALLTEMGRSRPYCESKPLVIEDVELDGPQQGEVLVEIAAAGLCHSDLSVIDGSRPRPMPMVPGHEAAGIVRELGPGVTSLCVDDHVVFSFLPMCGQCEPCASGRPVMCEPGAKANAAGELLAGGRRIHNAAFSQVNHHLGVSGFAEFAVASEKSLIRIGRDLSLHTAALFGCAVMTGVGAVLNTARLSSGSSVAIFGIGGVGMSAVMGARLAGAYPIIAVDRVADKLLMAGSVGATHVIDATSDDVVAQIKDITSGGAEFTIEAVGNAGVLADAWHATRRGGTTIAVGLPDPKQTLSIPAVSLVGEERTIKGSYMGSAVPRRDLPRYIELYHAGLLPVDKLFTRSINLNQINEGFDVLAAGDVVRQLVLF
jgi:Zn-dependent alcohol dehydrogenase